MCILLGVSRVFYSDRKSFVKFLLPPLTKGRAGVRSKIYDSFRIAILERVFFSGKLSAVYFLPFILGIIAYF
jgi:hypothetical protein